MFESTRRARSVLRATASSVCAALAMMAATAPRADTITSLSYVQAVSSVEAAQAAPPPGGGYFDTLLPGSALPSEADCAQRVTASPWEPRLENYPANRTRPSSVSLPPANQRGQNAKAQALIDRVSGNFTGTTDEIIQWASCKWGFSDEIVRAVAVAESYWYQGVVDSNGEPVSDRGYGDFTTDQAKCAPGYTAPCPRSFGIQQVKHTSHPGTFPNSRDSTAFNIDYTLMYRRVCYEGWIDWLKNSATTPYVAGDEWGCVGHWYSGGFHDAGADGYTNTVKRHLNEKPWRNWTDKLGSTTADITKPSAPTNLTVATQGSSEVQLSWTASTDNVGVTAYDIYRNNAKVSAVSTNSVLDTGLTAGTTYSYYVVARDEAGNLSPASTSVSATTAALTDRNVPVVSIFSPSDGASIGRSTTIQASARDDVAVVRMKLYIDGSLKESSSSGSISYTWTSRKAARGQHTITVKALDAAGNVGQSSVTVYR